MGKIWIGIVLTLISISIFGFRIAKGIQFKQNVSGYLKRAADANTIQLANEELTKALTYLESKGMTTGYTSVIYQTPDEDVDFWYRNLKASQNELATFKSQSAFEKTNILIKLRETLMDVGEKERVTIPEGMAVYPENKKWFILMIIALLTGIVGLSLVTVEADKKSKEKKKQEQ